MDTYTHEEYLLLYTMSNGKYFTDIKHGIGGEKDYKKILRHLMSEKDEDCLYPKDIYNALYGAFKRVPLYVNHPSEFVRFIVRWRMFIGR